MEETKVFLFFETCFFHLFFFCVSMHMPFSASDLVLSASSFPEALDQAVLNAHNRTIFRPKHASIRYTKNRSGARERLASSKCLREHSMVAHCSGLGQRADGKRNSGRRVLL